MIMKGNKNLPAFAKLTKDKMLLCTLCGELVKNESQWNLKHIRTQLHINYLKEMKENLIKSKEGVEKKNDVCDIDIINKNKDKEEKELLERSNKDILMKKALDKIDIDRNDKGLPIDFFEMNQGDCAIDIKERKIITTGDVLINIMENKEKDDRKKEEKNNDLGISEDNLLREQNELEEEADEMINNAKIIDNIINHYKIKHKAITTNNNNNNNNNDNNNNNNIKTTHTIKENQNFLNKKRNYPFASTIIPIEDNNTPTLLLNNEEVKRLLLLDILNDEW